MTICEESKSRNSFLNYFLLLALYCHLMVTRGMKSKAFALGCQEVSPQSVNNKKSRDKYNIDNLFEYTRAVTYLQIG